MAKQIPLAARLHADKIEPSELESMLLDFYTRAQHFDNRTASYGREEGVAAINVHFTRAGKIYKIEPGPAFKDEEITTLGDLIHVQLLGPPSHAVGRRVLFAGQATTEAFRYKDLFQLLPVPPEAPRPPQGWGDHPLLLEVAFQDTPAISIKMNRLNKAVTEIELLCSALLGPMVLGECQKTKHQWTMELRDGKAQYSYSQTGYGWDGRKPMWDNAFTPIDGIPSFNFTEPAAYYTFNVITPEEPLSLPSSFVQCLDIFFAMGTAYRARFLSACYWFQQGFRLWSTSQSSAFVAMVSAIEALTTEGKNPACTCCGKPTGDGPTKLFEKFIEKYVPDALAPRSTRSQLYSIRSQITHGSKILFSDQANWMGYLHIQDDANTRHLFGVVRIALFSWLMDQTLAVTEDIKT